MHGRPLWLARFEFTTTDREPFASVIGFTAQPDPMEMVAAMNRAKAFHAEQAFLDAEDFELTDCTVAQPGDAVAIQDGHIYGQLGEYAINPNLITSN